MKLTEVAPTLRRRIRWMPPTPIGSRLGLWLTRFGVSRMKSAVPGGVSVRNDQADSTPVRIYLPECRHSTGALVWIHGGGYLVGAPAMDDRFCGETCRELGIVIVSVDYRLSPEHPFPAAADDCLEVWNWCQRNAASMGVDPQNVAVGGQSAGAGLAAGLAQRVLDGGGNPAKAQWLFCPMLDDRTAARRELDSIRNFIWNNRSNSIAWRAFLNAEPGSSTVPLNAVPGRRDDLTGLPATWIGIGDIDLFYEEDCTYAQRLHDAGVDVALATVAGAPHGFEAWAHDLDIAKAYVENARDWLRDRLQSRGCSSGFKAPRHT